MLKVAEIVLLQKQEKGKKVRPGCSGIFFYGFFTWHFLHYAFLQDFAEKLNGQEWYKGHGRDVEIVDGQQRITTLLLIYAALQHQIFERRDVGVPGGELDAQNAYENITNRLRYDNIHGARRLGYSVILERAFDADGNRRFKFSERCDFEPDPKQRGVFREYLVADNLKGYRGIKEVANAIVINRWLVERAEAAAHRLKKESSEGQREALAWLLSFKNTLDERVLFTTTLTPYEDLALRTFVSYNVQSTKVALASLEVIKVALVSDTPDLQVLSWV